MYRTLWCFLVRFLFHIKKIPTHKENKYVIDFFFFLTGSIKANPILFDKGDAYP